VQTDQSGQHEKGEKPPAAAPNKSEHYWQPYRRDCQSRGEG
jgi:hypothetical protein